jgi:hypothetical protein
MNRLAWIAVFLLAITGMMLAQVSGSGQASTTRNASGQTAMPQAPTNTDAQATSATAASTNASATSTQTGIAAGTAINAELSKGLDSKKVKQGDPVQARVVQDVVVAGKVAVPRNAKLIGHVTQVTAGAKGQPSSLGIAFDKAVLKNRQEIPVHAVIQALAPAPRMPASSAYPDSGDSGGGGMAAPQPAGGYGSGGGGMNGGPVGGAAQTVGGVAGSATGAAGGVASTATNTAGGAVGNTTNTPGMTSGGQLTAASRGVMGMPGLTLDMGAANSTNGSLVTNQNRNVKLDGGTQLVLRVTAQ